MVKKKWVCSHCTYESGRFFNVERHIARKHNFGRPVRNPEFGTKSVLCYEGTNMDRAFSDSTLAPLQNRKIKSNMFADSYQFTDKKLKIFKDFEDALTLEPGVKRNLIMVDIYKRIANHAPVQSPWPYFGFQTPMTSGYIPNKSNSVPMTTSRTGVSESQTTPNFEEIIDVFLNLRKSLLKF